MVIICFFSEFKPLDLDGPKWEDSPISSKKSIGLSKISEGVSSL